VKAIVKFAVPMVGKAEIAALTRVIERSGTQPLTNGGRVVKFEEQFAQFSGGGIAVAVSSCMAALHLSLLAHGIGPGDEVIVPALTHPAMAQAVMLVGARPVFVDAHPDSGNLDDTRILINGRMKAISVVHYLGQPAYMKTLTALCRSYNLLLIEDCALALGAKHPVAGPVGLIGDAGCFSFYPAKHITTGEGGVVLLKNPEIADRVRAMRRFGHLNRDDDITMIGLNYRMTEFQAAIGLAQLEKAPAILKARRRNAELLRSLLHDYRVLGGDYALAVFVRDRDMVKQKLLDELIETSVYYSKPVPEHSYFRNKYGTQMFPVAASFCRDAICLPVGPHLSEEKIQFMAREFRKCAKPL